VEVPVEPMLIDEGVTDPATIAKSAIRKTIVAVEWDSVPTMPVTTTE